MDLRALLMVLWRKKWVLIIVPLFAVMAALALRMTGEWKYKSNAQLATGLTVSDELIGNAKYLNPYEVQVTFNNLIETIKSRSVMGQLAYRLMIHDLKDSTNAYRHPGNKKLVEKLGSDVYTRYPRYISILQQHADSIALLNPNDPSEKEVLTLIDLFGYDYETIQKELLIYRLNQSDFIEITYSSEKAQLSAAVVNTLCSEFIRYYSSLKDTRSNVSLESLTAITKQRKDFLDEKSAELQAFKANTDIVNAQVETETRLRQIEQYETQVTETRQKISALELTIANFAVRLNNQAGASASQQNADIIALKKRIDDANAKYITGGQKDNVLLDTLTHLRAQMDALVRAGRNQTKLTPEEVTALRTRKEESQIELEIARENLGSLNHILSSLKLKLGDFASKEAMGSALEKEVEVARQEYLASQTRLSEARDKMMTNKLSISQILMAEPAEKVESKKTLLFMIVSGALSFMICAFVIITIELMDSRIRTGQRFKTMTRLKLAGVLPVMDVSKLNWDDIFTTQNNAKPSPLSEEIRKIRFEIDNHMARVLLVTSVRENQGKSFFIIALAYSLGLLKKRVLIIDTNLRNNTLTRTFVVKPNLKMILENFATNGKLLKAGPGSSNGNGNTDEDPVVEEGLISKTTNPLIDIIGNKKSQLSPSEVIPRGDFKVLLTFLKNQYDYVILEGSALDKFSDSKELLGFVDLVIPVFAADATVETKDTEALNFLKSLQGQLGPAVLNKVERNG
ncbi:MAG TPA: Wzz/FepE/Etk N-terminal domain-containing protein [Cyclobacteriaceae bacterium]|nr:Wzz/FepE/Etk N-terminal domain-containing protein [Cyclobacteriaceae bacterium]